MGNCGSIQESAGRLDLPASSPPPPSSLILHNGGLLEYILKSQSLVIAAFSYYTEDHFGRLSPLLFTVAHSPIIQITILVANHPF